MAQHWHSLVANFAVVALFISTWVHGQFVLNSHPRWHKRLAFGAMMGLGAVASMLLAIPIDGALFDLRLSLIAIAGFFGGPIAGAVAVMIAAAYRLGVVGGSAASAAVLSMSLMAVTGWAVSRATRHRVPAIVSALLLSLAPLVISLALNHLLFVAVGLPLTLLSQPVALMNVAATALSAFIIMRYRVIERERDLLRAAFLNSPDFQYVKTTDSRFAAVNLAVARHHGFNEPAEMLGKTDLDLAPGERGQRLLDAEQEVLRSGAAMTDVEEVIVNAAGQKTWYLTTKVPLYNRDGQLIGLGGVTRDVTVRRRLRDDAEDARNRLNYVLAGVADGVAMFDRYGILRYCNEQYRDAFPLTREVRVPGAHIIDILRAVAATGEQKGVTAGLEDEWAEQVAATLDSASEQEVELFDGRWLLVRTRPTADGAALVVVSEVTQLKQTEAALLTMTAQLKRLATTDGLTGLTNRRAFDAALDMEMSRARRSRLPLSVLLCDVDRFKAYNDVYGHQAGDEALKAVGLCLKGAIKRPGDVAARYGGEEFVAVLPNTSEEGAIVLAEQFRESLKSLALPHKGSEHGVVTASIGVATLAAGDAGLTASELVKRADEALYAAKHAGRDRVTGWQPQPVTRARA